MYLTNKIIVFYTNKRLKRFVEISSSKYEILWIIVLSYNYHVYYLLIEGGISVRLLVAFDRFLRYRILPAPCWNVLHQSPSSMTTGVRFFFVANIFECPLGYMLLQTLLWRVNYNISQLLGPVWDRIPKKRGAHKR